MPKTHEHAVLLKKLHEYNMYRKRMLRAKKGSKDMTYVAPKAWSRTPKRDPDRPNTRHIMVMINKLLSIL